MALAHKKKGGWILYEVCLECFLLYTMAISSVDIMNNAVGFDFTYEVKEAFGKA